MKSKGIAVPYVIWMAIFVVAPLLIIVFYAFTSQAGGFTLENFSTMAQYTGVFGRSFLLAIIATFICLLIGAHRTLLGQPVGQGIADEQTDEGGDDGQ